MIREVLKMTDEMEAELATLAEKDTPEAGLRRQQLVQRVYVSGEVLVVVKVERFLIQLRQQSVIGIGQRRQGEGIVGFHKRASFPAEFCMW